jgi:hypothetical protein
MRVGIMQPYLFPYLGYYQLAYHSDKFVFYDDAAYQTRGFINRNNLLSQGKSQRFTLAVKKASQNKKINELYFSNEVSKILKTITYAYQKAPYFYDVMPIIESVLCENNRNVAKISTSSIILIFNYLGINKEYLLSSLIDYDRQTNAANKLISICKCLDVSEYCNAKNGADLYSKEEFLEQGIALSFIKMKPITYFQNQQYFINNLSIIDILMWNSKVQVKDLLGQYELF